MSEGGLLGRLGSAATRLDPAVPPSPHIRRTRVAGSIVTEVSGDYSRLLGRACLALRAETLGPGFPSAEEPVV